ncbi:unnamed protein product [Durusdinium trenchii]|uniref:cGMP-dependent protein kinase n=2 Tax=Durusdinium trenchii TaxID=1381693 RepID=A0ABP0PA17_9DINO
MIPIEPRLKPLSATILHYADAGKEKFQRSHSFSGYVPYYFLSDADLGAQETNCSGGSLAETDIEADTATPVWPHTDEEDLDHAPPFHASATSESSEEKRLSNLQAWSATPYAWAWTGSRPAPIGEKIIEGFGRALRKAVGETFTENQMNHGESCFHSSEVCNIEDFIWSLHRDAACRPVYFVYAFVYMCRMSELNAGVVELSPYTVRRLLLAAITITAKMQEPDLDATCYAEAGRVTLVELEHLEANFLELLQWNVDVCTKSFKRIFRLLSQAAV